MKNVLVLGFSIVLMFGCTSHDTVPTFTEVRPCSSLVSAKAISIYKYVGSYNGAAIGYEFKIKADGHLTGLGCAAPGIGNYTLALYKVDTVNKNGTEIAKTLVTISATDTVNFKFKYFNLPSKVSLAKGNYYRVALNGDFTSYDYLTFPSSSSSSLPITLPPDSKIIFTKGVTGYANQYPDTEYLNYMFPADVVIQFP